MLCSSAGPWKLVRGPHWSQMQLQVLGLIRPLTTHNSHRIDPISMPSPLADFMSCLKQVNPLSIHVALVSDNARIPSHGVMAHNGYREPSWPSRWASEKMTQISSQAPTRQISPQEGSLRQSSISIKCFCTQASCSEKLHGVQNVTSTTKSRLKPGTFRNGHRVTVLSVPKDGVSTLLH
jgi:hypothetical protein